MAKKNKNIDVWMLARVRGEKGEPLPVKTKQTVGASFGRSLINGGRAEPYQGQKAPKKVADKGGAKAKSEPKAKVESKEEGNGEGGAKGDGTKEEAKT